MVLIGSVRTEYEGNCLGIGGSMKTLLAFIRLIPGFFRLYCNWEYTPKNIKFIFHQYSEVMTTITGNKMSKLSYYAKDVIQVAQEFWCEECDLKQ